MNRRIIIYLVISCSLMLSCSYEKKSVYVELSKVIEEFSYTKELQSELKKIKDKRQFYLDSIESNLKFQYKSKTNISKQDTAFERALQNYNKMRYKFKENEIEIEKDYNEKIYKQINQYIKEYGQLKKYEFIYGANGSGNIMYADSSLNITQDVIYFVNKRFSGR